MYHLEDAGSCAIWDVACVTVKSAEKVASAGAQGALQNLAEAVADGAGKLAMSLGAGWTLVDINAIGAGGNAGAIDATPPAGVSRILGFISWYGFAIAVIALIILGIMMTIRVRRGDAAFLLGKLGAILGAVLILSSASGIVSLILNASWYTGGNTGTAMFLRNNLLWATAAIAVGSTLVGATRMAFTMRADAGRGLLEGLIRLAVVSGASFTITNLVYQASNAFTVQILASATNCDLNANDGACFGTTVISMFGFAAGIGPLGVIVIIITAGFAVLFSLIQIVLMVGRTGMVILLTGILPTAAAAAMSGQTGKTWFDRVLAWLIAWVLYKPVAAIVYAAAMSLMSVNVFKTGMDGLLSILLGLTMMALAIIALPALMRLVTPMVGALASGAGGGAAAGMMAALPTGAIAAKAFSGGSGGGKAPSGSRDAGPSATGASDASQHAAKGAGAGGGSSAGSGAAGSGAAGSGAAGSGAAGSGAAGSGAASGGAASGASAGAAAGPWGAAAGAAAGAVTDAANKANQAAQGMASGTIGDPSGSN